MVNFCIYFEEELMGFATAIANYGVREKGRRNSLTFWPEQLEGWRGVFLQWVTDVALWFGIWLKHLRCRASRPLGRSRKGEDVHMLHLGTRTRLDLRTWESPADKTVFKGLGPHGRERVQAEKRCKSSALGLSTEHRSSERGGTSLGDGEGIAERWKKDQQRTMSQRPR